MEAEDHVRNWLRGFLRLRDLTDPDDSEQVFTATSGLVAWTYRAVREDPVAMDRIMLRTREDVATHMGLPLHFATVDRNFNDLAKRMALRTLERETIEPNLRKLSVAVLSMAAPEKSRTNTARDALICIAVATAQNRGFRPTQSAKKIERETSGSAVLSRELQENFGVSLSYSAIEKVWKNRYESLIAAGFPSAEVSDFFSQFSPMK